jgi:hypothetical protein
VIICVPEIEPPKKAWPSLGPQVVEFIEANLVFGPGDLRGMPARVDDEKRDLIHRAYEVYPKSHALAGRRRFKRVAWSLRKGSAKTELAAWIAACELSDRAPVRTIGWEGKKPVGGPVSDPYIPMMAYTEDQSEELAYGALRVILENSEIASDFDIGLDRIMRVRGDGKAEAVASAPNSNDGARTTWQHFDESHRMTLPRIKQAHQAMLANTPKRKLADAWSLETTTAFSPGEMSVAEDTWGYAQEILEGKKKDAKLFFFHRQASTEHDLTTKKGLRAAIAEASGPVAEWSDLAGIEDQFADPTRDRTYLERVWLNRPTRSADTAFDSTRWAALAKPHLVPKRAAITLGFDGSRSIDATGLVGTEIVTGYQWVLGVWERPANVKDWKVPVAEVNALVEHAFAYWDVWRLYADPPYWEDVIAEWMAKHNPEEIAEARVVKWYTASSNARKMASAVLAYANAISQEDVQAAALSHDGNEAFARHIANAHKRSSQLKDERGVPMWTIQKERPDSPKKIDLAMAGILSWQARMDARALGVGNAPPKQSYKVEFAG